MQMAAYPPHQGQLPLSIMIIRNAQWTGRELGSGAFARVEELVVDGAVCAGKVPHDALVRDSNVGVEDLRRKYEQECRLLYSLHHPHIVQFLGLCYSRRSHAPVLVMEKLHTSLDTVLGTGREHTRREKIPFGLKGSMLTDVACGLVYLHHRNPPVIHRDLTAKNVLLTSAMVAKISDLGNARISFLRPEQVASLTKAPGTSVYMPPEALYSRSSTRTSHYGPSIDIFSFGHLLLYTITEVCSASTGLTTKGRLQSSQ